MNVWTTFSGRIMRSSVWTLKRSIAKMICDMNLKPLSFPGSLESSLAVNQAFSECGLSCLVHPNCWNPACVSKLASLLSSLSPLPPFFFLADLTVLVHSLFSEIYFYLTFLTIKYVHHLPFPKKVKKHNC